MQSSKTKTKHFSFLLLITLGVMTAFGPLTMRYVRTIIT